MSEIPAMTPQQRRLTEFSRSPFATYRELATGEEGLGFFALYEGLTLLCSGLPGIIGFGARALSYPFLLCRCGRGVGFGRGIVIRRPRSISVGSKVLIDDYAALDVRGVRGAIDIGDHVAVGRFTTIAAKDGAITIEAGANIGSYCRIATQSEVRIGASALIAAYCYIGPGNHQSLEDGTPLISAPMDIRGGVTIGARAWIGTRSTILDGVTIGEGAIVGAHSLVREDVPAGAVVAGAPARIIRDS